MYFNYKQSKIYTLNSVSDYIADLMEESQWKRKSNAKIPI